MTVFWIMTGLLAALAGLLVLTGARRGVDAGEPVPAAAAAAELAELDRLKARGLLDEAGWTAARAEAGRRILAGQRDAAPVRAGARDRWVVLGGIVATVAAALGLYALVGQVGLPDQPWEGRVDEWTTMPPEMLEAPQLAAVIGRVVEAQPDNVEALRQLGAARFMAGDPVGAVSAFRRVLAIEPGDATTWSHLGESLVRMSDGAVDGDAEAAFREALKRDPDQLGARYFLGEAALARGDAATVREMWTPLIAALAADDPRRADLVARMPGSAQ